MTELRVRPEAELDAFEAASWYERERDGLGSAFLAKLRRVFDRIETRPLQYPLVTADVRRAVLGRFPFGVFFFVETISPQSLLSCTFIDTRVPGRSDVDTRTLPNQALQRSNTSVASLARCSPLNAKVVGQTDGFTMSFPKKGTRKIVVAGSTYLWRVGVDDDWMNPTPPNPTDIHSLVVESPDHPGRYLAVGFALPEEHTGLGFAITPGIVADVLRTAIAQGWPAVERPWHRIWRDGELIDIRRSAAQQGAAADDVLPRSARSERHR